MRSCGCLPSTSGRAPVAFAQLRSAPAVPAPPQSLHHASVAQAAAPQSQRLTACQAAGSKPGATVSAAAPRAKYTSNLGQGNTIADADLAPVPSTAVGKLISKTEVAAFIQRDDLMDQMFRWAIIEAGEGGMRNFGLPMNVTPFYFVPPGIDTGGASLLWGFKLGIFKEGEQLCELAIMYDQAVISKHEWVGRGDDGFPVLEGKVDVVVGKHFEIWKLCESPVDETLRSTIRAFCTGLVTALNRYYAFGSVFVDDAQ